MKQNKNLKWILFILVLLPINGITQSIGIGTDTPDSSAILDVSSTSQGIIFPRLSTTQRDAIPDPATGLVIFNITDDCFNYYTGTEWVKDCGTPFSADVVSSDKVITAGGPNGDAGPGAIKGDRDGNVYIVGSLNNSATFNDTTVTTNSPAIYLAKYDINLKFQWVRTIESNMSISVNDLCIDPDENPVLVGSFSGSIDIGNTNLISSGGQDVFLCKYDPDGNPIWARSGGGTSADNGNGIACDGDGNLIVTGSVEGTAMFGSEVVTSNGSKDVLYVKYDPDGTVMWALNDGGIGGNEIANEVAVDQWGNLIVTGRYSGTASFGGNTLVSVLGSNDVFTAKYDTNGNFMWVRSGEGAGSDMAFAVAVDPSGNISITGFYLDTISFDGNKLTAQANTNQFLVNYDLNGNFMWMKNIGGGGFSWTYGEDVVMDEQGSVIALGYSTSDIMIGDSIFNGNNFDFFGHMAKYDSRGNFQWAEEAYTLAHSLYGYALTIDAQGNIVMIGNAIGTLTYGDTTLSYIYGDMVALKYDSNGKMQYASDINNLVNSQDQDSDPTNELQTISSNGSTITLSNEGGSVDLSGLETDPQVGNLTFEYLPKWNGSTLINSSIRESGSSIISSGNLYVNDLYANRYYDKNNTQYFMDPTSSGTSLRLAGTVRANRFEDEINTNYYVDPFSSSIAFRGLGDIFIDGSMYSPRYYDTNNTAYYLDLASTGTALNIAGEIHATRYEDENNTDYYLDPASTNTSLNIRGDGVIGDALYIYGEDGIAQNGSASEMYKQIGLMHPLNSAYQWWIGNQADNPEPGDNDLYFYVNRNGNDVVAGLIQDGVTSAGQMNFTGQHRSMVRGLDYTQSESSLKSMEGMIVVADQDEYLSMSGGLQRGKDAIMINEALPIVSLSSVAKDKRVFGVLSSLEPEERMDSYGAFATPFKKEEGDERMYINSVGEGAVWIVDEGGALESGDYIQSSNVKGYGMRQEDDLLHNYTVAKITMNCDFEPRLVPRMKLKKMVSIDSGTENEVNVLDELGRAVWEPIIGDDGQPEMEYQYEVKYLNEDGAIISKEEYNHLKSKGQEVFRAAFVGCTYHCG